MPDDTNTQVAEPEGTAIGNQEDEQSFFESDDDEDKDFEGESSEKENETNPPDESETTQSGYETGTETESKAETDTGTETETQQETDQGDDQGDKSETDTETDQEADDEDILRGRELLSRREKSETTDTDDARRAQQQAQEQAQRQAQQQAQANAQRQSPAQESYDTNAIETINKFIPKNLFPKDPVKLSDGTELDYGHVMQQLPELPTMITGTFDFMVRELTKSGYLLTGKSAQDTIGKLTDSIKNEFFLQHLTHPEYGVPNAAEIAKTDEFQKWYESQPNRFRD